MRGPANTAAYPTSPWLTAPGNRPDLPWRPTSARQQCARAPVRHQHAAGAATDRTPRGNLPPPPPRDRQEDCGRCRSSPVRALDSASTSENPHPAPVRAPTRSAAPDHPPTPRPPSCRTRHAHSQRPRSQRSVVESANRTRRHATHGCHGWRDRTASAVTTIRRAPNHAAIWRGNGGNT